MKVEYDKYYQTSNLFGSPYPELIDFYSKIEEKGDLSPLKSSMSQTKAS